MTPNPNVVRSPTLRGPTEVRLQLDPAGTPEPYLDGAWWPRSTELAAELPGLISALSEKLGPTALIGYDRDAWTTGLDQLDLAGQTVHLQGFVSPSPPTLVVVDNRGRRVTLRVVPPETEAATAAKLMAAAATHHPVELRVGTQPNSASRAEATSLDEVAARLARLPGNTGPERAALISQWVVQAADQFRDAPITAFIPILVEHIVRTQLTAASPKDEPHRR
jgi:hypothetical protein